MRGERVVFSVIQSFCNSVFLPETLTLLINFEQWDFFLVPQLLWHGASVYNGLWHSHLLPSVLQWIRTTSFCDCRSVSLPSACEVNALTDCATAAVQVSMYYNQNNNTYINIHILTPVPESKKKSPVSLFVYKETKGQVLLTRLQKPMPHVSVCVARWRFPPS